MLASSSSPKLPRAESQDLDRWQPASEGDRPTLLFFFIGTVCQMPLELPDFRKSIVVGRPHGSILIPLLANDWMRCFNW